MKDFGPPEMVIVETDWYDGPRAGICLIGNKPHRFVSNYDEAEDEWLGTFRVAPIDQSIVALEVEQWKIFVDWNELYESEETTTDQHPGTGGIHPRYDEIESLLHNKREVPSTAQHAAAIFERTEQDKRYDYNGPDYQLRWRFIQGHKACT